MLTLEYLCVIILSETTSEEIEVSLIMEIDMKRICQKIAEQNRTTPEEDYRRMQEAIHMAYSTPQTDDVLNLQTQIPQQGTVPTPEEMIVFLCKYMGDPRIKCTRPSHKNGL